jgi:hypothetical protein
MAARLSALRAGRLPFAQMKIPGTRSCLRLSRPLGHSAAGRIRSIHYCSIISPHRMCTITVTTQTINKTVLLFRGGGGATTLQLANQYSSSPDQAAHYPFLGPKFAISGPGPRMVTGKTVLLIWVGEGVRQSRNPLPKHYPGLTLHRPNFFQIIYIKPVRTSQEPHYVSATMPNRLMLFRETVAVYCDHKKRKLCGQNVEI